MKIPNLCRRLGVFYGWVVVFVCFVLIGLAFGVRLSFGLFFDTLTRSDAFGWARADTAGVFSMTMIIFALTSTASGWALDRWGARRVFSAGLLIMAVGVALTSRMSSLFHFYIFYGVITGLGITVLGLSLQAATISRWFDRLGRRGLAIGVAFSGTGMGILVLAPILETMISQAGWRAAYLLLALLLAGVGLPLVALLLRNRPENVGLLPDGLENYAWRHVREPEPADMPAEREQRPGSATAQTQAEARELPRSALPGRDWTMGKAVQTAGFWLLMLSGAASLFTVRMVSVHQVAHFVDSGVSRVTAATILGSGGLITAVAFIAFGLLSDRIGRARTFYLGAVTQALALLLLINLSSATSLTLLYLYAFLWGIGEGSRSGLLTAIAGDLFTGPALGMIVGTLGASFGVGAAVGSWLAGLIYDTSGSYLLAFQLALGAIIIATLCIAAIDHLAHAPASPRPV